MKIIRNRKISEEDLQRIRKLSFNNDIDIEDEINSLKKLEPEDGIFTIKK